MLYLKKNKDYLMKIILKLINNEQKSLYGSWEL